MVVVVVAAAARGRRGRMIQGVGMDRVESRRQRLSVAGEGGMQEEGKGWGVFVFGGGGALVL